MDIVILSLLAIGLILFFGSFAEFIFKRVGIPDVLFLIILGFVIGPVGLAYITPADLAFIAPIFTTFTLLFLLFDGAFNIDLSSLIKEFSDSVILTLWNFLASSIVICAIMLAFGFSWGISLLTGFALGGVSSSFVIPVLRQLKIPNKTFSLLTLESALTDVFCIVLSLAVLEFLRLGAFGIQQTATQIVALFAVGAIVGMVAGILWYVLVMKFFKEHNYVLTVAYLLVVFVVTEFLQGSGAIAALFFGLSLNNSKMISSLIKGITTTSEEQKNLAMKGELGISITTKAEEFFYGQISFFLKTFFFVYVGLLIEISNLKLVLIGVLISFALMFTREASEILRSIVTSENKGLVNSMFARGLAAAAIAQIAIAMSIPGAEEISQIIYVVITGTIVLSSIRLFVYRRHGVSVGVVHGSNVIKKQIKANKKRSSSGKNSATKSGSKSKRSSSKRSSSKRVKRKKR